MSAHPNLEFNYIAENQADKHITANEAFQIIADALTAPLSKSVAGTGDIALSDDEALEHVYFDLTGILTGNRNVIVPNASTANCKLYICKNSTTGAFTLTVKTAAGTGIVIGQGGIKILYCDGTNVIAFTPAVSSSGATAQVAGFRGGMPDVGETILRIPITVAVSFPTNMTGSLAELITAPAGTVAFSIRKNGSQFATMDFASAATTATFTGSATSFVVGDFLSIVAPSPQDATLADLGFNLLATVV